MANFDVLKKYQIDITADTTEVIKELNKLDKEAGKKLKDLGLTDGLRGDLEGLRGEIQEIKKSLTDATNSINGNISKINTGALSSDFKETSKEIESSVDRIKTTISGLNESIGHIVANNDFKGLSDGFKLLSDNITNSVGSINTALEGLTGAFKEVRDNLAGGVYDPKVFQGSNKILSASVQKDVENFKKLTKTIREYQKINKDGSSLITDARSGFLSDSGKYQEIENAIQGVIDLYYKLEKEDIDMSDILKTDINITGLEKNLKQIRQSFTMNFGKINEDVAKTKENLKTVVDSTITFKVDVAAEESATDIISQINADIVDKITNSKKIKPIKIPVGVKALIEDDKLDEKQKQAIKGMSDEAGIIKAITLSANFDRDAFIKDVTSKVDGITNELKKNNISVSVDLVANANTESIQNAVDDLQVKGLDGVNLNASSATVNLTADGSLATENTLLRIEDILKSFGKNGKLTLSSDSTSENKTTEVVSDSQFKSDFIKMKFSGRELKQSQIERLKLVDDTITKLYSNADTREDLNNIYKLLNSKDKEEAKKAFKDSKYYNNQTAKRDENGNIIKGKSVSKYWSVENGIVNQKDMDTDMFHNIVLQEFEDMFDQIQRIKEDAVSKINSYLAEKGTDDGSAKWQKDLSSIKQKAYDKLRERIFKENKDLVSDFDFELLNSEDDDLSEAEIIRKNNIQSRIKKIMGVQHIDSDVIFKFKEYQEAKIDEIVRTTEEFKKGFQNVIKDINSSTYILSDSDKAILDQFWKKEFNEQINQIRKPYAQAMKQIENRISANKESLSLMGVETKVEKQDKKTGKIVEDKSNKNKKVGRILARNETLMLNDESSVDKQVATTIINRMNRIQDEYDEARRKASEETAELEEQKSLLEEMIALREKINNGSSSNEDQNRLTSLIKSFAIANKDNNAAQLVQTDEDLFKLIEQQIEDKNRELKNIANRVKNAKNKAHSEKRNIRDEVFDDPIYTPESFSIKDANKEIQSLKAQNFIIKSKVSTYQEDVTTEASRKRAGKIHKKGETDYSAINAIDNIILKNNEQRIKHLQEMIDYREAESKLDDSLTKISMDTASKEKQKLKEKNDEIKTKANYTIGNIPISNAVSSNYWSTDKGGSFSKYSDEELIARRDALSDLKNELDNIFVSNSNDNKILAQARTRVDNIIGLYKDLLEQGEKELASLKERWITIDNNENLSDGVKTKAKKKIDNLIQRQIDKNKMLEDEIIISSNDGSDDKVQKVVDIYNAKLREINNQLSENIIYQINKVEEELALNIVNTKNFVDHNAEGTFRNSYYNKLEQRKKIKDLYFRYNNTTDSKTKAELLKRIRESQEKERLAQKEIDTYLSQTSNKKFAGDIQPFLDKEDELSNKQKELLDKVTSDDYSNYERLLNWKNSTQKRMDDEKSNPTYNQLVETMRTNIIMDNDTVKSTISGIDSEISAIDALIKKRQEDTDSIVNNYEAKKVINQKQQTDIEQKELESFNDDIDEKINTLYTKNQELEKQKELLSKNTFDTKEISNLIQEYERQINEINNEIDNLKSQKKDDNSVSHISALKSEISSYQNDIANKRGKIVSKNENISSLKSKIALTQESIKHFETLDVSKIKKNDVVQSQYKLIESIERSIDLEKEYIESLEKRQKVEKDAALDQEIEERKRQLTAKENKLERENEQLKSFTSGNSKNLNAKGNILSIQSDLIKYLEEERDLERANIDNLQIEIRKNESILELKKEQFDAVTKSNYEDIKVNTQKTQAKYWEEILYYVQEYKNYQEQIVKAKSEGNQELAKQLQNELRIAKVGVKEAYGNFVKAGGNSELPKDIQKIFGNLNVKENIKGLEQGIISAQKKLQNYDDIERKIYDDRRKREREILALKELSENEIAKRETKKQDFEKSLGHNNQSQSINEETASSDIYYSGMEKRKRATDDLMTQIKRTVQEKSKNLSIEEQLAQAEQRNKDALIEEEKILKTIDHNRIVMNKAIDSSRSLIEEETKKSAIVTHDKNGKKVITEEEKQIKILESQRSNAENKLQEAQAKLSSIQNNNTSNNSLISETKAQIEDNNAEIKTLEKQRDYISAIKEVIQNGDYSKKMSEYQVKVAAENDYWLRQLKESLDDKNIKNYIQIENEMKQYHKKSTDGFTKEQIKVFEETDSQYLEYNQKLKNSQDAYNKSLKETKTIHNQLDNARSRGMSAGLKLSNETGRLFLDTRTDAQKAKNTKITQPKKLKGINYSKVQSQYKDLIGITSSNQPKLDYDPTQTSIAMEKEQADAVKETKNQAIGLAKVLNANNQARKKGNSYTEGMTEAEKEACNEVHKYNKALNQQNALRKLSEKYGDDLKKSAKDRLLSEEEYNKLVQRTLNAKNKATSLGLTINEKGYVNKLSQEEIASRKNYTMVSGAVDVNKIANPGALATERTLTNIYNILKGKFKGKESYGKSNEKSGNSKGKNDTKDNNKKKGNNNKSSKEKIPDTIYNKPYGYDNASPEQQKAMLDVLVARTEAENKLREQGKLKAKELIRSKDDIADDNLKEKIDYAKSLGLSISSGKGALRAYYLGDEDTKKTDNVKNTKNTEKTKPKSSDASKPKSGKSTETSESLRNLLNQEKQNFASLQNKMQAMNESDSEPTEKELSELFALMQNSSNAMQSLQQRLDALENPSSNEDLRPLSKSEAQYQEISKLVGKTNAETVANIDQIVEGYQKYVELCKEEKQEAISINELLKNKKGSIDAYNKALEKKNNKPNEEPPIKSDNKEPSAQSSEIQSEAIMHDLKEEVSRKKAELNDVDNKLKQQINDSSQLIDVELVDKHDKLLDDIDELERKIQDITSQDGLQSQVEEQDPVKIPASLDFNIEDLSEEELKKKIQTAQRAIDKNFSTADAWNEKLPAMQEAYDKLVKIRKESEKVVDVEEKITIAPNNTEEGVIEETSASNSGKTTKSQKKKKVQLTPDQVEMRRSEFRDIAKNSNFDYNKNSLKVDSSGVITFTKTIEKLGEEAVTTTYKVNNLQNILEDGKISLSKLNSGLYSGGSSTKDLSNQASDFLNKQELQLEKIYKLRIKIENTRDESKKQQLLIDLKAEENLYKQMIADNKKLVSLREIRNYNVNSDKLKIQKDKLNIASFNNSDEVFQWNDDMQIELEKIADPIEKAKYAASQLGEEFEGILNVVKQLKNTKFGLQEIYTVSNSTGSHASFTPEGNIIKGSINIDQSAKQVKELEHQLKVLTDSSYAQEVKHLMSSLYDKSSETIILKAQADLRELEDVLKSITNGSFDVNNINNVIKKISNFNNDKFEMEKNLVFGDSIDLGQIDASQAKDLQNTLKTLAEKTLPETKSATKQANISFGEFSNSNRSLEYSIKTSDDMLNTYILTIDKYGNAVAQLKTSEKYLNSFQKLWTSTKKKFGEILNYTIASVSIYEVFNFFRRGVSIVQEFDTAMVELEKVSKDTEQALNGFKRESFEIASQIGSTGKEIVNSAADWEKLGLSISEASELAKNSALYANVGDMEIDTATEHMVSTLKAFNIEATNSIDIVDKFNQIGNNYAITSEGIGSALERSAASLVAAGNDLDESIALVTAGNIISQDAESVGNAIKVLSLRIRGSKTELEDMGEETDNLASSTSKLREEIKSLTGVDIMLDNNTYKSTYEIMLEISKVWDKLSDVSQAATLEKLAGKTRASVVAGLLQQGETLENVYNDSKESFGSAMAENEKYLNSIQGHIDLLDNAWQKMWTDAIQSRFITFIVDIGTKLLNIVDAIGAVKVGLAALGGLAIFKMKSTGGGRANKFALIEICLQCVA